MIDNLINGNLLDARKAAKRYGFMKIRQHMLDLGYPESEANATAWYLKGLMTFQRYCDSK
jgi:hypothetical protein